MQVVEPADWDGPNAITPQGGKYDDGNTYNRSGAMDRGGDGQADRIPVG
jgi:hypothetical protein